MVTISGDGQNHLILIAASKHDLDSLSNLLRTGSASVQDPETKNTPLHAAIAACEVSSPSDLLPSNQKDDNFACDRGAIEENGVSRSTLGPGQEQEEEQDIKGAEGQNGGNGGNISRNRKIEAATQTLRLLLENGAIWNDVNIDDETPGCLAWRLKLKELYEIMVEAGVRAEMLLSRLDEYEMLRDTEEEEVDDEEAEGETVDRKDTLDEEGRDGSPNPISALKEDESINKDPKGVPQETPLSGLVPPCDEVELNNDHYLQNPLSIQSTRILDSSQNGVMMSWEADIMRRTATLLAPTPSLRILNIGHGMGIIDTFFQQTSPTTHHIIEAHPSILMHMRQNGWYDKPNVVIHPQRWQDAVPALIAQGVLFDAIYFDTFAEDYKALRDFFSEFVIGLLDDAGRWGFFNGLGADRQVCYDVYGKVVEMDLFEAGFDTEWESLEVPAMEKGEEWEGVKRRYWAPRDYRLPICTFLG